MQNVFSGILVWLLFVSCKAIKDPCEGLEDGIRLPHAIQCDRFVICKNKQMFSVGKCPRGLHFNRRLGVCDFKQRARCDVALALPSLGIESSASECCNDCCGCCNSIPNPYVPSIPDAPFSSAAPPTTDAPALPNQPIAGPSGTNCSHRGVCENQPDGAMFPDPGSNGYIVCQCQCEIIMPCPSGLIFNSVLKVCDWPKSTSGTSSAPYVTTQTSLPFSTTTITFPARTLSTPTYLSTPVAPANLTSDASLIPGVTTTTAQTSSTPSDTISSSPSSTPTDSSTPDTSPTSTTIATFTSDTSTKTTESSTPDTSSILTETSSTSSLTTSSDISSTAINSSTQDISRSTSSTNPTGPSTKPSDATSSSTPSSSTSNTPTTLPSISTSGKPSTPSGPATGPSGTTCDNKGVCENQSDGTMFADPDSNGYIVCQCECEIKMPCPSDLIFNSLLKVCDWPSSEHPKPSIPSTGPSGTVCSKGGKCEGQKDGTLFPDPESSGYIVCQCECEISMPCPGGLVFNPNVNVCDWPTALV